MVHSQLNSRLGFINPGLTLLGIIIHELDMAFLTTQQNGKTFRVCKTAYTEVSSSLSLENHVERCGFLSYRLRASCPEADWLTIASHMQTMVLEYESQHLSQK